MSASASSKSAALQPSHGFAFTSRTPLSQFGMSYGADHWLHLLCYGVLPASDVSLPLLAALLERVPVNQLPDVFADTDLWLHLLKLLDGNDASQRFAATCVAASLCRAPVFASALFEFGGLAAMGRDGLLGQCLKPSNWTTNRGRESQPGAIFFRHGWFGMMECRLVWNVAQCGHARVGGAFSFEANHM